VAIHEIRGPLSAIALALQLWRRSGALPAEALDGLLLELECAARGLRALEALHGRTPARRSAPPRFRAEMGPASPACAWVALAELIACTVEAMQGLAARHHATLSGRWSGQGACAWGDPVALSRAIANLIANALEHGEGAVAVHGRLCGRIARVEVCDHGPGLPAPLAVLIAGGLKPRRAAGEHLPHQAGARGWGLKIVAELAARHGGRLGAAPSAHGTRLVLELPARPASDGAAARRAHRS
jgi:signal transduction histidine kinase